MNMIKPTFGFCKVEWTIEDFNLLLSRKENADVELEFGSEFRTKWQLSFKPGVRGCLRALLMIKRLPQEENPVTARLDYKICLRDSLGNEYANNFGCKSFMRDTKYGEYLADTKELGSEDLESPSKTLIIECQFMTFPVDRIKSVVRLKSQNALFREVSRDLLGIYESRISWDVILRLAKKSGACETYEQVFAHRVILHHRCKELVKILSTTERNGIVDLSHLNHEAMRKVLMYLYSGNTDYVTNEPSFEILECLSFLKLEELEFLYFPKAFVIRSAYRKTAREFTIELDDDILKSIAKEECYTVDLVDSEDLGYWKLRLEAKEISKERYIHISAIVVERKGLCKFDVEYAIMKPNNENNVIERQKIVTPSEHYLHLSTIKESLRNGAYSILCNIKAYNAEVRSEIEEIVDENNLYAIGEVHVSTFEEKLLNDLNDMYKEKTFADVTVDGVNEKFHKCILCARSIELRMNLFESNTLDLNGDPKTISCFLKHVYGITEDVDDFKDPCVPFLYQLAVEHHFKLLADKCLEILIPPGRTLDIKAIFDYYLLNVKDSKLKETVLESIFKDFNRYRAYAEKHPLKISNEDRMYIEKYKRMRESENNRLRRFHR